jgi:manganese transport protein
VRPPRRLGPGWVVAAAFVGPGTVTTATLAGARFGEALLWALVLAVGVAFVLQEMAARVALATGKPLAAVVREAVPGWARPWIAALVVGGIGLGNAAFQAGNLAGASLGLAALVDAPIALWAIVVADAAFLLLWFGRPRLLEAALQAMVLAMLVAFAATLALLPVDAGRVVAGLAPTMPPGSAALALGLLGTTVVPYNLFLHASLAARHGWGPGDARAMRRDAALAIGVGGAISASILLTSALALPGAGLASGADMAAQLRPLLGDGAGAAFALGLFAAGMTSAVTAPLAAAYAITHVLGWDAPRAGEEQGPRFRVVWGAVLLAGLVPVLLGIQAVPLIVAAQALNGLLLPLLAALVLVAANQARLGALRNGPWANAAGALAMLAAALLGAALLLRAAGGA